MLRTKTTTLPSCLNVNDVLTDMRLAGRKQAHITDFLKPSYSPAYRGTKKHVYLPYRGAIPFWFYLVPLRLVSIFLNVVRTEISCGLLPTRFLPILI